MKRFIVIAVLAIALVGGIVTPASAKVLVDAPPNTVGTTALKDGAVTTPKLALGSIWQSQMAPALDVVYKTTYNNTVGDAQLKDEIRSKINAPISEDRLTPEVQAKLNTHDTFGELVNNNSNGCEECGWENLPLTTNGSLGDQRNYTYVNLPALGTYLVHVSATAHEVGDTPARQLGVTLTEGNGPNLGTSKGTMWSGSFDGLVGITVSDTFTVTRDPLPDGPSRVYLETTSPGAAHGNVILDKMKIQIVRVG